MNNVLFKNKNRPTRFGQFFLFLPQQLGQRTKQKSWVSPNLGLAILTSLRMGIFGTAHGWEHPKIFHTYPAMMKLGTIIPYLKKIQNTYESRHTPHEFC